MFDTRISRPEFFTTWTTVQEFILVITSRKIDADLVQLVWNCHHVSKNNFHQFFEVVVNNNFLHQSWINQTFNVTNKEAENFRILHSNCSIIAHLYAYYYHQMLSNHYAAQNVKNFFPNTQITHLLPTNFNHLLNINFNYASNNPFQWRTHTTFW